MDTAIFVLCAATSAACSGLLLRSYRQTGFRLLLLSGLCFAGLSLTNVLLILDRMVFLTADLSPWRLGLGLLSTLLLVVGLVLGDRA